MRSPLRRTELPKLEMDIPMNRMIRTTYVVYRVLDAIGEMIIGKKKSLAVFERALYHMQFGYIEPE
jgi:hypothetical protein